MNHRLGSARAQTTSKPQGAEAHHRVDMQVNQNLQSTANELKYKKAYPEGNKSASIFYKRCAPREGASVAANAPDKLVQQVLLCMLSVTMRHSQQGMLHQEEY